MDEIAIGKTIFALLSIACLEAMFRLWPIIDRINKETDRIKAEIRRLEGKD